MPIFDYFQYYKHAYERGSKNHKNMITLYMNGPLDISLCETLEETLNFEGRSELRHLDVFELFSEKTSYQKPTGIMP